MTLPVLSLFAAVDVESGQASYLLASAAIALAITVAALKAAALLARPEAHKLCVGSLALILATFSGRALAMLGCNLLSLPAWVDVATLLIALVAAACAWLMSIVGLIDYRRWRSSYQAGRLQAALALALATIPLGFAGVQFGSGFVQGFQTALARERENSAEVREGQTVGEVDQRATRRKNDDAPSASGAVATPAAARQIVSRSVNPQTTQRFGELNFQFTPPEVGWIKLHAPSVNREASVAYTSKAPQMIFFIIAERIGADVDVQPEALLEIVQSNIYASFDDVEFSEPKALTVSGIEGVSVEVTYVERANEQRQAIWLGAQGGFLFQLATMGRAKHADRLDERHQQMLEGFRVIDQSAVVYSQGRTPIREFKSTDFGYEIELRDGAWLQANGETDFLPAAEMAATLRSEAAVAVVPILLPSEGANLNDLINVVAGALVNDLRPENRSAVVEKQADAKGAEEISFHYQATSPAGASVAYRFRALREGRRAVMAVGLTDETQTESLAAIEQSLATLRLVDRAEGEPTNHCGSEEQRLGRGVILNELGLLAFEQQNRRLSIVCFEEAIKLQPESASAFLNYAHVLAETGELEKAITELESSLNNYKENHRLREKLALLLFEAGDHERCAETLRQLLADGFRSEDALAILTGAYMKQEKYDEAIAAIDEYLQEGPSPQATQLKAVLLSKTGDHDGAIAILEEVRSQRPRDVASVINLAIAMCEAERYEQALALVQQLLADGKKTEEVYLVLGRCHLGMKQYREAKETFELALKANPRSRDAEEAIAVASAMLGQGNNSIVKTPIDPAPMPEEIAQRLAQITPDDQIAGAFGAYENYRIVGYDYRQGDRLRTTVYRKIKVVGSEGIEKFSTLTVTFNPLAEQVYVNRLAVFDAAGTLIAEGNPNDYYVVADAQSDLATGDNTLTIPVPQLQPGNTIEYTLTRQRTGAEEFGYEEIVLASSIPVQAAAAFVVGDVDKLAHTTSGPEARSTAAGGLFWGVSGPPVNVDESSQPPISEFLPVIHLADAGRQWRDLGNEYATKIADRLEMDEVTKSTALELTAGLASNEEKIAALTRFVQQRLNYQGLEFGVRGLMPNCAAKSLEIGYGDCKDHSVLLKQLLNAVGIQAQLTLVNATGEVDGRLPSSSQFDHMIVSIPGPDGGDEGRRFIDCTAKHSDPMAVTADDFEGRLALVVEDKESRLVPIPQRTGVGTDIRCAREIVIVCDDPREETADAIVREEVAFSSATAGTLRAGLGSLQPRDRQAAVARLISEYDTVDVTRLQIVNLDAPKAPLILQLEYRLDNVFHRVGDVGTPYSGRIVSPWESWAALAYSMTERLTPFRTTSASIAGATRYVLPDGFVMDRGLEPINSAASNRFLSWSVEADRASNSATLRVERRAGTHAAADYHACALEAKDLTDRLRRPVSFVRAPSVASGGGESVVR